MNEPQNLRTSEPHGNSNVDLDVVEHFGNEWRSFDNEKRPQEDLKREFDGYFSIFPWDKLPENAVGFDAGCGNGRWAKFVLQNKKVGLLNCIDPSGAIEVAKKKLGNFKNVRFFQSSIDDMPIEENSQDFGYCLGVLHHIPDTEKALQTCVDKLKPGAPFLLYLYPKLDYRPLWWRCLDQLANGLRHLICRLPHPVKIRVTDALACLVYWPVSRLSLLLEKLGISINIPLSSFKHRSFYDLRTNALDTFGTPLEKRFSQAEITQMMTSSGLERISFGSGIKWVAVGYKKDR